MLVGMKQRSMIRVGELRHWAFALCIGLVCAQAWAQPDPPGQTAADRVIQAHRAVRSATVEVDYGVYFGRPDETEFVTSRYRHCKTSR